ncbi:U-scoloptoxin(01)-Er1a-like [Penaeus chinensis]|uniref:U-scoloptoxin(01)-Er1a-like n=1 Tax=Penaeus chinensis TaxID=139456 RepID=UPI001FB5D62D|nr:U-scoloptoxin(01)-Er1a-like [Penaeus chinensis]
MSGHDLPPPAARELMPLSLPPPPAPPTATLPSAAVMKVFAAAALLCLVAAVSARMAYQLPADAVALVRNSVREVFSCQNRAFGYYADVANDCRIFHVCQPIADEQGQELEMAHFSFICGNQTVFNQEALTCTHPEDAFPCEQAETLFDITNSEFFRIPEESDLE